MISKVAWVAVALMMMTGPSRADPAPSHPPAASGTTAPPASATPDVATLLFELPQWGNAPIGTSLTYSYTKKVDAAYGPSFDDKVVLKLGKGDDDASRTVDVNLFTGAQAKPAGPFRSTAQNPVLLIALEANVEDLAHAWHANPRFMKTAVRNAWRDKAKIEKAQIEVAGKSVPGTRITIQPYKDSSESSKMMGLQTMVYAIEISDEVPGGIISVDIHAPAVGTPTFQEVLRYKPS